MRRLYFLLALLAMCLLCACHEDLPAAPQELPAVPEPAAAGTEQLAVPDGLAREADGRVAYYKDGAPVSLQPGVQQIAGAAYYVAQDGGICAERSCVAQMDDGRRYCFQDDCSLRWLEEGLVTLFDGTYYAAEDGYALADDRQTVIWLEDAGYALDESGRVLQAEPGVQEFFGKTYLVQADGQSLTRHEPGPWLREDGLYFVQADGSLLTGGSEGYLYFGADGRYTSGNETLDEAVSALLLESCGEEMLEPEQMLRAAYTYLRDHYTYLSMEHYEAGTTDWAESCALTFFDLGKGNCYCWAAAFCYCARQLGYQAYVVAGAESRPDNDHAWTMIDWPDGKTYLFDAQLEYAYWYMFENTPKVDMFKASGDGTYYGTGSDTFAYFFP